MSKPLQVGTTASFPFGPFITTAGVAATDLTINASVVFISKNGATLVKLNNTGTSLAHDKDGWYDLTLDVTDLNTIGPSVVETNSASALHVWENIQVMTVPGYKFLFGSTGASHVDQMFEDLSSLLNESSLIITKLTSVETILSSVSTGVTRILEDTTIMKVQLSSLLNESSALIGTLDSVATRVESLQEDTTAMKPILSSISTGVTHLLEDTSSIKVSVSSLLNESTFIISAISSIPATVLGVINDQVIDSTITDLERRRITLAGQAGLTTGAGTTSMGFLAAGTASTRVRIAAILTTLGERTAVVLDGTT